MLDEIHQHPLKNHKKQNNSNSYISLFGNTKGFAKNNDKQ
jgi:hypothetical protein